MTKVSSPTWRLSMDDAFGGKFKCEYEYRHALWTMLEVAGFHRRSILSLIEICESEDLTFERVKAQHPLPENGDPREILVAFIYGLFREKLGEKLKAALSEFVDEVLFQAVREMERRNELLKFADGETKGITDLVKYHSGKRKRQLESPVGRNSLFRSEYIYRLMLHKAKSKLMKSGEPITKENVLACFAEEDEKFLDCDPARITGWNKKFHVDWKKFKGSAM